MKTLIRNGWLVTMNARRDAFQGDLLIAGNRIEKIGRDLRTHAKDASEVDATDHFVIPGLIQGHTHLCQTLFRGDADDLSLLDWLKKRIWPMEAAHTEASLRSSAEVGLLEMQKSGTTTILDMGTVRHTDALLETAGASGMRYWGGKCLMDFKGSSGPLYENTAAALRDTERLIRFWKGREELVSYALCPRFAISCTEELLEAMVEWQGREGLVIHTHASENKDEIALVKKRTGKNNVDYLDHLGMLNRRTVIAHGVHLTKGEVAKMAKARSSLVHCPSSNLKLGSGIAPIEAYRKAKLNVCLGADGAPCNNSMDAFIEMRLAALLQKPALGPKALPARVAFEMATVAGAKALGMEREIGSLEEGKLADVVTVKRDHPSVATVDNPYSALVYSCLGRDVANVWINGRPIVRDGEHQVFDESTVLARAKGEHRRLLERIR